jgi:hypothetical protein
MITPAVLISASGTLVLSTSNRLTRVVDRVRVLADKAPNQKKENADTREFILDQLARLSHRALLLRSTLTSLYVAIGMFVSTSISVAVVSFFHWQYSWIPVSLGLVGSCSLLYGSVLLILEGRYAIASTLHEMNAIRRSVS